MRAFKNNLRLRKLSLAYVLDYALEEAYFQFKPAFIATLWPTWALGISRAIDNLLGFLGYHFAGKIIGRFGALRTLLVQHVIGRVVLFVAAGLPTIAPRYYKTLTRSFFGVGATANGDLMHKEFTDKQRATMGSLNSFAGSLAFAIVMFGIGLIADQVGPAKTILILAGLSVSVIAIYGNLFKKHNT